jgi:hypothetical protein
MEFYVIVHPAGFNDFDLDGKIKRKAKNLKKIIDEEDHLIIGDFKDASRIHHSMPKNSDDLKVRVCGSYYGKENGKKWCIDQQIDALKKQGYNARIYLPASLQSRV